MKHENLLFTEYDGMKRLSLYRFSLFFFFFFSSFLPSCGIPVSRLLTFDVKGCILIIYVPLISPGTLAVHRVDLLYYSFTVQPICVGFHISLCPLGVPPTFQIMAVSGKATPSL